MIEWNLPNANTVRTFSHVTDYATRMQMISKYTNAWMRVLNK